MSDEPHDDFATSLGFVRELLITELSKHKLEKKTLLAPYHPLKDKMQFSSWKDDFLPLITWGTLLVSLLERDAYLEKFREIIGRIKYRHENFKDKLFVDHVRLKNISNTQFDYIFEPLLSDITRSQIKGRIRSTLSNTLSDGSRALDRNPRNKFHRMPQPAAPTSSDSRRSEALPLNPYSRHVQAS